jgi:CRISPR-associated protein Cmr4
MITATKMLYLYVETPLHAGVGSGLSSVDLPIQRERTTQYPMIQGSGIKGKFRAVIEGDRDQLSDQEKIVIDTLFGPPTTAVKDSNNDHAGALIVGDARILLFPVRSLNGVFAYTTSYDVLNRFKRDIEREHPNTPFSWSMPDDVVENTALVTTRSEISANDTVVLEEFSFKAQESPFVDEIAQWIANNALPNPGQENYWYNKLRNSLVILPNNDFRDFVLYATEIISRVQLDRTKKTVIKGALWTEEYLPTDTLLYAPIYATDSRRKIAQAQDQNNNERKMLGTEILVTARAKTLEKNQNGYLQLGGDETVGRGIVRILWGN